MEKRGLKTETGGREGQGVQAETLWCPLERLAKHGSKDGLDDFGDRENQKLSIRSKQTRARDSSSTDCTRYEKETTDTDTRKNYPLALLPLCSSIHIKLQSNNDSNFHESHAQINTKLLPDGQDKRTLPKLIHPPPDEFNVMVPILRNPMCKRAGPKSPTNKPNHLLKSPPTSPQRNGKEPRNRNGPTTSKQNRILIASILQTVMLNPTISSYSLLV